METMDNEAQNIDLNDTLEDMKEVRKSQESFEQKYAAKKKLLADSSRNQYLDLAETLSEAEVLKELIGQATRDVTEIIGNLRVGDADGGLISMLEALKKLQVESSSTINDGVHEGDRLIILRSKKPERRGSQVCPFGNEDHDHPKD